MQPQDIWVCICMFICKHTYGYDLNAYLCLWVTITDATTCLAFAFVTYINDTQNQDGVFRHILHAYYVIV